MMTMRPLRGAPTSVPPSPCCCQLRPSLLVCFLMPLMAAKGGKRKYRWTNVFLFFPVVCEPYVPPVSPEQLDGRDGRQGDPLVRRAEEHVEFGNPGRGEQLGVGLGCSVEQG